MKKVKYDIFISYRREAYDTANLIAEKLRNAGYSVFFDIDALTSGKFNEQLINVISECKDFILVLPQNALDRCQNEGDWIRREVLCALQNDKNIIPVMLDGFVWPKEMPQGMEELSDYQAIAATGHEFFDMAVQRLQGFLKSKPAKPIRKWMIKAGIALGVILVIMMIGAGIVHHIAGVTCNEIGTKLTSGMNTMELLTEDCKTIKQEMVTFYQAIDNAKTEEDRKYAEEDMILFIEKIQKDVESLHKTMSAPEFSFNSLENYVLAYYDIDKEELIAFSTYYNSMFDEMDNLNSEILSTIERRNYSQLERDNISLIINCFEHYINGFYYGYMGSLSLLPKSAREKHFKVAKKWKCFPNGTPLDLSQEEYEQFQMQEVELINEEINRFNAALNYTERQLNELGERIDELEKIANMNEN